MDTNTNTLWKETSPYLLAHAHQRINWQTWSNAILDYAKEQNKMLFISIGYSACHWCKQMSEDCFEDQGIADILNRYYVCIKVDKEERPDIDQFYLNAIELMTDNGGWPISCFALSNGWPIFGGTYFSGDTFLEVILDLQTSFIEHYDLIVGLANEVVNGISHIDTLDPNLETKFFTEEDMRRIIEPWRRRFDTINGGTHSTPKFPLPSSIHYLELAAYYLDDPELSSHAHLTLKQMSKGGICDPINGGFYRYSTDSEWKKPHFEKMLYDNAMLAIAYSVSYKKNKDVEFEMMIRKTIDFLNSRLKNSRGSYSASLSADSNGREGGYYLWSVNQVKNALQDEDFDLAKLYLGIENQTNPNADNVLCLPYSIPQLSAKLSLSEKEILYKIKKIRKKLQLALTKRKQPACDSKVITGWNALTIRTFCEAYFSLGDTQYLKQAKNIADLIIDEKIDPGFKINRIKDGEHVIPGFLDDYAFTINGFLQLYQATGVEKYLDNALGLTNYAIRNFFDNQSGMFYLSPKDSDSPMPIIDFVDKAKPSSNSIMAFNLTLLYFVVNNIVYKDIARQMLNNMYSQMSSSGPYIAHWARLMVLHTFKSTIAFTDPEKHMELVAKINRKLIPNLFIFPINPSLIERMSDSSQSSYIFYLSDIEDENIRKLEDFVNTHKKDT